MYKYMFAYTCSYSCHLSLDSSAYHETGARLCR